MVTQEFDGRSSNSIPVLTNGFVCGGDVRALNRRFAALTGPGVYGWFCSAPWAPLQPIPMYFGKGKPLGVRLRDYLDGEGNFGPRKELKKFQMMNEVQRHGFSVVLRYAGRRCWGAHSPGQTFRCTRASTAKKETEFA